MTKRRKFNSQYTTHNLLFILLFSLFTFSFSLTKGQSLDSDSVFAALQGSWRMNEDTNVVLTFYGDSLTHHMLRSWGHGRSHFLVTDRNCDTTRFVKRDALYIVETYRYYRGDQPLIGELCNKIIHFKNNVLILKRDGIFESYTRLSGQ